MNNSSTLVPEAAFSNCVESKDESPASFSARLAAFMIDTLLLGIVYSTGIFLAGYNIIDLFDGELQIFLDLSVLFSLFVFVGPVFISMIYYTVLHAYGGQTIGKAIMGIRVVAVSGGTLGYGLSWIRWVGYQISALPLFAGFLWIVLDVDSRAWHDILARTKVVNEKRP